MAHSEIATFARQALPMVWDYSLKQIRLRTQDGSLEKALDKGDQW